MQQRLAKVKKGLSYLFICALLCIGDQTSVFATAQVARDSGNRVLTQEMVRGSASNVADLLVNGSFEDRSPFTDTMPAGWETDAFVPDAVQFKWDDQQVHGGSRSIKITNNAPNDARWLQTVVVQTNKLYLLSGWIKTENVVHSDGAVVLGANLCLHGTWTHSTGLLGTNDWTYVSVLFNSGEATQVTVGARLGYWSGTATGTAWFDDLQLVQLQPVTPHPSWKVLVLIYGVTNFTYTDKTGTHRHIIATMSQAEKDKAASEARRFVEQDIPALNSSNMTPTLTIRYPTCPLMHLSPSGEGWWPAPGDTARERDPIFDSVIVIWDPRGIDQFTGEYIWIGSAAGLAPAMGTGQTYTTLIIEAATQYGHRNVFKHEWGHSIVEYFDAIGTAPKPKVEIHTDGSQYVHCPTGEYYVWEDETDANPIPNSIYHNASGFTHDYYSGSVATADQPTRCLGISAEAWAYGGPVTIAWPSPVYSLFLPFVVKQ